MADIVSRSLILVSPHQLVWQEDVLPPLQPDEVLVKTVAGAISLGTELAQYRGDARHSELARYPQMTGYESLGVVIACGEAVSHLHIGSRVVSFYGHRTYAVLHEDKPIIVPPGVSDKLALLSILTCDVAKGIGKVQPWLGESVLVTGAGAIGLLTVWMLRTLGATMVDVLEPQEKRRAMAQRLGARQVFANPDNVPNVEYEVGFECSSRNAAFALLQQRMRRGGRICVLADGNIEPLTLTSAFHERELQIVGSSDGWDYHAHAAWYFDTVQRQGAMLEQLFDLEVSAAELAATFARLSGDNIDVTKVLVRY